MTDHEIIFTGALLRDPKMMAYAALHVPPEALAAPANAILYRTALALLRRDGKVSIESVRLELSTRTEATESSVDWSAYLSALQDACNQYMPDMTAYRTICAEIINAYQMRRIRDTLIAMAEAEYNTAPSAVVGEAIGRLTSIVAPHAADAVHISEMLDRPDNERRPISSTSLLSLDDILGGGFVRGDYCIVAARPSVGKSAYGCQLAVTTASNGEPTLIISLEACRSIGTRLCRFACAEDLRRLPLWVNASPGMTIDQVTYAVQMAQMLHGITVVVIDYIGLIRGRQRSETANDYMARVSGRLQSIARERNVLLVALAQLNRDSERDGREPMLHDLRDSGSLEQDADVVIFIHRPGRKDAAKMIVAKNREGPTGVARLVFDSQLVRFFDAEPTQLTTEDYRGGLI